MKTVVIIGASFAGLRAYTYLKRKGPKDLNIILIDKHEVATYIPSLHLVLGKQNYLNNIQITLKKYYPEFVHDEVTKITKTKVYTKKANYTYDYVIVASGATTNYYGNDKLKEVTYAAKTPEDLTVLNKALTKAKQITIVGGGITGVEYAGILASRTNKDITLISATPRLIPGISEKASAKTKSYLESKGVEILLNTQATSATKSSITINNKEKLPADLIIWCAGIKQSCPFITEEVSKQHNVFFAGDVTRTSQIPTAHNAMIAGNAVAKCVINQMNGKNDKPQLHNWETLAVALSPHYGIIAIGNKRSIPTIFTGLAKWFIEKRILFEWKKKVLLYI